MSSTHAAQLNEQDSCITPNLYHTILICLINLDSFSVPNPTVTSEFQRKVRPLANKKPRDNICIRAKDFKKIILSCKWHDLFAWSCQC